jgi:eukaryotic-like serine/threonine-protein kinase
VGLGGPVATIAELLHDRYLPGALIGVGGMGEVFEGYDRALARRVAIKVLVHPYDRNPVFLARFEREAQAAASLGHPNIVGVYDIGEQAGTHFMVMEHVDGRTLRELLDAEGPLEPGRATRIAMQACSALTAAHQGGIVHRDVKPSNVMVTADDHVKVMDFGLAAADAWEHITTPSAVLGTAKYISPEHAQRSRVDARSDIYSLGVCLYELLTGHAPFEGLIPVAIVYCHVNEQPQPPAQLNPAVSPELEAVVMRALAKDPDLRYQTAEELRADLERVLTGQLPFAADPIPVPVQPRPRPQPPEPAVTLPVPVPVRPPAPVTVPRMHRVVTGRSRGTGRRRGRPAWAGLAVLLAAALAGLAWFVLAGGRDGEPVASVTVPDVRGLEVGKAVEALKAQGFDEVRAPGGADSKADWLVVAQDPYPGTLAARRQTITLTVYGPSPKVKVPAVRGMAPRDAADTLRSSDLEVAQGNLWRDDPSVPAGRVVATVPPLGTVLEAGRAVRLVVSLGDPPADGAHQG